jgi:stress-induced morphogen
MNRHRRLFPVLQPLLHRLPIPYIQSHIPPFINPIYASNFSTSPHRRSTNFDTLKVVQRLEEQGFTSEQSRAVMQLLKDVIDESILGLTRTMVTREEQDKVLCPQNKLMTDGVSTKSRFRTVEK